MWKHCHHDLMIVWAWSSGGEEQHHIRLCWSFPWVATFGYTGAIFAERHSWLACLKGMCWYRLMPASSQCLFLPNKGAPLHPREMYQLLACRPERDAMPTERGMNSHLHNELPFQLSVQEGPLQNCTHQSSHWLFLFEHTLIFIV